LSKKPDEFLKNVIMCIFEVNNRDLDHLWLNLKRSMYRGYRVSAPHFYPLLGVYGTRWKGLFTIFKFNSIQLGLHFILALYRFYDNRSRI
jgi:hypothetical protein